MLKILCVLGTAVVFASGGYIRTEFQQQPEPGTQKSTHKDYLLFYLELFPHLGWMTFNQQVDILEMDVYHTNKYEILAAIVKVYDQLEDDEQMAKIDEFSGVCNIFYTKLIIDADIPLVRGQYNTVEDVFRVVTRHFEQTKSKKEIRNMRIVDSACRRTAMLTDEESMIRKAERTIKTPEHRAEYCKAHIEAAIGKKNSLALQSLRQSGASNKQVITQLRNFIDEIDEENLKFYILKKILPKCHQTY